MKLKTLCFAVLQIAIVLVLSFDLPHDTSSCITNNTVTIGGEYFTLSRIIDVGDATPTNAQYDVYGNLFFILIKYYDSRLCYDAYVLKSNADASVKIDGSWQSRLNNSKTATKTTNSSSLFIRGRDPIGLPHGACYCIAMDNTYDDVYFGTAKGVFRYQYEGSNATRDSGLTSHIQPNMLIVDRDGNKYVSESNNGIEELFILEGDKKILYKTIHGFNEIAIDSDNWIFFIQENGLFFLKLNEIIPIHIRDVSYRGIAQINFYKNMVFVAAGEVVYFHKNIINTFKHLELPFRGVVALAFSKGSIIVGTRGKLYQYDKFDCISYIRKS